MVELSINQVRRGGHLAVALAFGALNPDSEVLHRVADRVVHASYRSCVSNDRATRATARSMIDDVASGVIDRVCYCFDTPLDNAGASQC